MLRRLLDWERIIHSIKATIACILAILLMYLVDLPRDPWIVITIIVVMCAQIYVGSVIQKSYFRFLGTLVGCLFATITLALLGATPLAAMLAIGSSIFIFSYIATSQEQLMYTGTLGAVTTAIIMLSIEPSYMIAAQRFLEISVGIFIAAF